MLQNTDRAHRRCTFSRCAARWAPDLLQQVTVNNTQSLIFSPHSLILLSWPSVQHHVGFRTQIAWLRRGNRGISFEGWKSNFLICGTARIGLLPRAPSCFVKCWRGERCMLGMGTGHEEKMWNYPSLFRLPDFFIVSALKATCQIASSLHQMRFAAFKFRLGGGGIKIPN